MRFLRHFAVVVIALMLCLGIPVYASGYVQKRISGADAVSSATVILDQPSGAYVVFINEAYHPDREALSTWETFFIGGEIDFLFEDISCIVAEQDAGGLEMARSFQSRLPEHQMSLRREDGTLLCSKVLHQKYDVVIFSREFYDAYLKGAEPEGAVVKIEGGGL